MTGAEAGSRGNQQVDQNGEPPRELLPQRPLLGGRVDERVRTWSVAPRRSPVACAGGSRPSSTPLGQAWSGPARRVRPPPAATVGHGTRYRSRRTVSETRSRSRPRERRDLMFVGTRYAVLRARCAPALRSRPPPSSGQARIKAGQMATNCWPPGLREVQGAPPKGLAVARSVGGQNERAGLAQGVKRRLGDGDGAGADPSQPARRPVGGLRLSGIER